MAEHKYAQVLRWIADGEDLQHIHNGAWFPCDAVETIACRIRALKDKQ